MIAEQAVTVTDKRIFGILKFAPLPELQRDDVLFLKDVVDLWHAVTVGTRKGRRIIGMDASAASHARHVVMMRNHEASVYISGHILGQWPTLKTLNNSTRMDTVSQGTRNGDC